MRLKKRFKKKELEKPKRKSGNKHHKIIHEFKGLPETKKEKERRIKILKEDYLEGNYIRFVRKLTKRYYYQLVYSRTLPRWRKENKKAVKKLLSLCVWPSHVVDVANILYTLEKHFGWAISEKNVLIAFTIWEYLDEDIYNRMHKKYVDNFKLKIRDVSYYTPKPRQAFKEQLARGFIHINDFDDFDKNKHHVYSNVKKDYIYPLNFGMTTIDRGEGLENVYIGQSLVGVRGWTRAQINERVLHKN